MAERAIARDSARIQAFEFDAHERAVANQRLAYEKRRDAERLKAEEDARRAAERKAAAEDEARRAAAEKARTEEAQRRAARSGASQTAGWHLRVTVVSDRVPQASLRARRAGARSSPDPTPDPGAAGRY